MIEQLILFDERTLENLVEQGKLTNYKRDLELKELYGVSAYNASYWDKIKEYDHQKYLSRLKSCFEKTYKKEELS